MLIGIFRSNQPYTGLFVPLVAGLLCLPLFTGEASPVHYPFLGDQSWVHGTVVLLLVSAGALMLNRLVNREEFTGENTHLPALWYLLICGPALSSEHISSLLFANLFLILGLRRLLFVFRQPRALAPYFEAGFWTGIGSLIHHPYLFFFVALLIAIFYTRTFNFREFIMPVLGGLIPWVYLVSLRFMLDKGPVEFYFLSLPRPGVELLGELSGLQWLSAGLLFLGFSHGIWQYFKSYGRSTNRSKNTKSVFLIWSLASLPAMAFLLASQPLGALAPMAISSSVVFSFGSHRRRNEFLAVLISWLWVLLNLLLIWKRMGF